MKKEIKINGIWYLLDIDKQEAMVIRSQDEEYSDEIIIQPSFFHEGITYSVTRIGEKAFWGCYIYSVVIPDSIMKIESKAFECCWELEIIRISSIEAWCNIEFNGPYSNPLTYAKNLYINEEHVTDLIIPSTVPIIKDHTFSYCEGLTSVTILDGVTKIGEGAFIYCTNIESVTFSESVVSIGKSAFEYCINLITINLSNGVINIGDRAFDRCHKLVSVIGGNRLKSIGNGAFNECRDLTSFDISDNVEIIGDYAFYDCYSLGVIIPHNLVSIGKSAFYKCCLDSITIPESLVNIDKCAFKGCYYDCESLEIIVEEGNPIYDSRENCNAIIETKSNTLIIGCDTTKIPNSIISIGDEAFSDWDNLYSITIPHGVKSIGKEAFGNCYKLCSVIIPDSVIKIEGSAFNNCYNLGGVYINSLESWCKIDFSTGGPFRRMRQYETTFLYVNGKSVSELEIPNSITSINNHVFEGFYLKSVVIPKSITSIGNWSFNGCSCLCCVTIPNSVTHIGEGAFFDCCLSSVVIPKTVKHIEKRAFGFCDNMTYVTILGSPIIMEQIFYNCNKLRDLYCYGEDVPEVHNTFEGLELSLITLHVPIDAIEKYQKVEPWNKFGCIVPIR